MTQIAKSILIVGACLFSLAVLPLQAGNIVVDPSFEAGGPSCFGGNPNPCPAHAPWVFTPGATPAFGISSNTGYAAPGGGAKGAFFGAEAGDFDTISQVLTTTPGQPYLLTFWLNTSTGQAQADFQVYWNSTLIYEDTPGTTPDHAFDYKMISIEPLLGTGTDTLKFQGYNPPQQTKFDLVSVEAVPEPATGLLLCAGALALTCWRRHRRA